MIDVRRWHFPSFVSEWNTVVVHHVKTFQVLETSRIVVRAKPFASTFLDIKHFFFTFIVTELQMAWLGPKDGDAAAGEKFKDGFVDFIFTFSFASLRLLQSSQLVIARTLQPLRSDTRREFPLHPDLRSMACEKYCFWGESFHMWLLGSNS